MRELTARQSSGHIRELLDFQTVQARRLEADGSVTLIPAQSLQCDDMALMLAGDLVPATRRVGDMVFAGSSIVEGSITVQVTAVFAETVVAKIVQLIEAAPVGETRIQNYAEQFADRLVAPLLGVNVAMLALTGNVDRFMSMAIVDYGTGIRVAAPTSILIKSGHHVEQLATLPAMALDCSPRSTPCVRCWHRVEPEPLTMADLYILRKHKLGLRVIRKIAFTWAELVEAEFGMRCIYQEGRARMS